MSEVVAEHRTSAPETVRCAVVTVSDTRTRETDTGGQLLYDLLVQARFQVPARELIPDEPARMRPLLENFRDDPQIDAVLMTGGTGLTSRDQTFETVSSLITKALPGYGELFRLLSYQEIGPAAMLSRAVGGLMERTVVLTMPGSPAAVRLAMERMIVPELRHLVREARR
ncbi:MAG: MogA/MoaB family molybdenum cofactor biosynthesis protein [Planctomycetia bacterium]|nr:MogA/MoaB family molybdenum cofactor biosynthesis protein [Planctomycetia bacterium]